MGTSKIPSDTELLAIIDHYTVYIEALSHHPESPELDKVISDYKQNILDIFKLKIDVDDLDISDYTKKIILDNRFSVLLDTIRRVDSGKRMKIIEDKVDEVEKQAENAYNTAVAVGMGEREY